MISQQKRCPTRQLSSPPLRHCWFVNDFCGATRQNLWNNQLQIVRPVIAIMLILITGPTKTSVKDARGYQAWLSDQGLMEIWRIESLLLAIGT
jgi:hypothetical protein